MERRILKKPIERSQGESEFPFGPFLSSVIELSFLQKTTQLSKKEETTMATKKSMCILVGILATSAWVLGSTVRAGAETMNYKLYTYVTKQEVAPVGDVEGHVVVLTLRGSFLVFENGEVATVNAVITSDTVKGSGSFMQYVTMKFPDDSTIIVRSQGTVGTPASGTYTSGGWTSEIIKGTGRFEGIKGTVTSKAKYLPVEKGEPGPKGIGAGTITYTLPSK